MSNIKILVVTHKKYSNIIKNDIYMPIEVGASLRKEKIYDIRDNIGKNISVKNSYYSELTALYWAWKNNFFNDCDYCGLVHYRRYFIGSLRQNKINVLSKKDIEILMSEYDIIVPKKRNYFIETIEQHYSNAHFAKDINIIKDIIEELYPEYIQSYNYIMNGRKIFLYNMFIMKKKDLLRYCEWLFNILFIAEKRIDYSKYDDYQKRVFGFLSERLFNIWVLKHNLKTKEIKVKNIEGENLFLKGLNFLKRKYKIS